LLRVDDDQIVLFDAIDKQLAFAICLCRFEAGTSFDGGDRRVAFRIDYGDRAAVAVDHKEMAAGGIVDDAVGIFRSRNLLQHAQAGGIECRDNSRFAVVGVGERIRHRAAMRATRERAHIADHLVLRGIHHGEAVAMRDIDAVARRIEACVIPALWCTQGNFRNDFVEGCGLRRRGGERQKQSRGTAHCRCDFHKRSLQRANVFCRSATPCARRCVGSPRS
jgi:hypothetical protein